MLFTKLSRHLHQIFAILVVGIATLVMLGWIIESQELIQIRPDFAPMVFNAALGLATLGLSVLFSGSRYVRISKTLAAGVFVLGALTLLEYFLDVNLRIDNFFIKPFYAIGTESPGRMSVSTGICFMILGLIWFEKAPRYVSQLISASGSALVIGFASIGILSYLGGFNSEYGWGSFSSMAAHSALCLFLLAGATFWHLRLEIKKLLDKTDSVLIPFYVLMTGILISIFIWQSLIIRDQERNRKVTQIRLEGLKASFDNVFAPLEKSLENMARRFASGGYPNEKMWLVDTVSYYQEFEGLRRLIWADQDSVVKWIYPMTNGGAEMVNVRIGTNNKELEQQIKRIMAGKGVSLSKIFDFRSGGRGFMFFVPILKNKKYQGTVAAVLLSDSFFSKILKIEGYDIEVLEDGKQVFRTGIPDPVFARDWTSRGRYAGRGVTWDLRITPTPAVVRENTSALPGVVLLFGVSVSVLLGVALSFYNRARDSEREARQAFEWKEAGMNSVPLLIISLDANTMIRELNATAEKVLGYETDEVVGKSPADLFYDPAEVRAFREKMEAELKRPIEMGHDYAQAMFELGYHRASEWTQISRDGTRRTVIISISEIHDDYGRVTGYLKILEDVTALKDRERLLKEQEIKIIASSRLASLGEMAAGIAHEINNPLAIINGHVGILRKMIIQKGLVNDPEIDKKIESIESVVQRIAKIIRGLRSYARETESGSGEWVKVLSVVDDTLSFCEEKFKLEDVELTMSIPEDLEFRVQPYQISQVLLNLLNNAFDAIHGGKVKRIAVEAFARDGGIEISVSDTGPGIPYDLRARIMQPFFTTKEVGKGVGLGLSISQGIIQGHGGKFYLDENSARTRFVIWLPKDSKPNPL